mgnify:CR=1 FL=1
MVKATSNHLKLMFDAIATPLWIACRDFKVCAAPLAGLACQLNIHSLVPVACCLFPAACCLLPVVLGCCPFTNTYCSPTCFL